MINELIEKSNRQWFCFDELFAVADLHVNRIQRPSTIGEAFNPFFPRYFDRQGFPIPESPETPAVIRWAQLSANGDYKIIQQDMLHDGGMLSTIWLGLDHGWLGPPLIFETMRFSGTTETMNFGHGDREYTPSVEFPDPTNGNERTECLRYRTEEEAHAMHNAILRAIKMEEYQ